MPEPKPENSNQPPAEQRPNQERELSTEQKDEIMKKVQNILKPGTYYTGVGNQYYGSDEGGSFIRMLKEGILSQHGERSLKKWALKTKKIMKDKELGKEDEPYHRRYQDNWVNTEVLGIFVNMVTKDQPLHQYHSESNGVTFVLDISEFKELPPLGIHVRYHKSAPRAKTIERTRQFSPQWEWLRDGRKNEIWEKDIEEAFPGRDIRDLSHEEVRSKFPNLYDHQGEIDRNDTAFGSFVSYMIPPKKITGVIIGDYADPQYMVKVMQQAGRYVPIYDMRGNLRWPKYMGHEEVKKFIAERDAKHPSL
ncbi:MAG: hypothetical protein AAB420_01685 [Patescibacteria group bacterium]